MSDYVCCVTETTVIQAPTCKLSGQEPGPVEHVNAARDGCKDATNKANQHPEKWAAARRGGL